MYDKGKILGEVLNLEARVNVIRLPLQFFCLYYVIAWKYREESTSTTRHSLKKKCRREKYDRMEMLLVLKVERQHCNKRPL